MVTPERQVLSFSRSNEDHVRYSLVTNNKFPTGEEVMIHGLLHTSI